MDASAALDSGRTIFVENLNRRAAVKRRGLEQGCRDALEEVAHQHQIIDVDGGHQDDDPQRVRQVQVLHDEVSRNHAALENHREEHDAGEEVAAGHVPLNQHIRADGGEEQTEERTRDGRDDGNHQQAQQRRVREYGLIARKAEVFRPELHAVAGGQVKRVNQHLPQRNKDKQAEKEGRRGR